MPRCQITIPAPWYILNLVLQRFELPLMTFTAELRDTWRFFIGPSPPNIIPSHELQQSPISGEWLLSRTSPYMVVVLFALKYFTFFSVCIFLSAIVIYLPTIPAKSLIPCCYYVCKCSLPVGEMKRPHPDSSDPAQLLFLPSLR